MLDFGFLGGQLRPICVFFTTVPPDCIFNWIVLLDDAFFRPLMPCGCRVCPGFTDCFVTGVFDAFGKSILLVGVNGLSQLLDVVSKSPALPVGVNGL